MHGRGVTLSNLGIYGDAITCYEQVLKYKPNYYLALSNKGWALSNLLRYEDAIASMTKLCTFNLITIKLGLTEVVLLKSQQVAVLS
ncbi:MAG: tetratricopeptide repeat protein [Pleurocapsa sp. CRU_1_2]|nr:tetratricopeptide repeat protein [Pleurocapsa sp. CRU_1_2]